MDVILDGRTVSLTDDQLTMYDGLTKLQKGVTVNSLSGMKPADAHRDAGGQCRDETRRHSLAGEVLSNPAVVKFIDSFKTEQPNTLARAIMTREDMLSDLTDIAGATIFDVMEFHNGGDDLMNLETGQGFEGQSVIHVKSMDQIDPKYHKLIKGVKQTKHGIELTLHDQMQARKQIADLCGYNAPKKQELSGPNGGAIRVADLNDEDFASELATLGLDVDGL